MPEGFLPEVGRGPVSGVGVGLRSLHLGQLLREDPPIDWLEILADNYLATGVSAGGPAGRTLDAVCERYPVTLHSVGMNLGGVDPLDWSYLGRLRDLRRRTGAAWLSDHLCFTRWGERYFHDLLPLPYTEEAVRHVAARIGAIQNFLGDSLVVENVSAYAIARSSAMSEGEFLRAVAGETGCRLLLDVNNLYVSEFNLGTSALETLGELPLDGIAEIHLAGHRDGGGFLVDAHNDRVSPEVWSLFESVTAAVAGVPVLIEWDNDLPALDVLLEEADKARGLLREAA